MSPARGAVVLALATGAVLAPLHSAETRAAPRSQASQCTADERVVYSCRFGRKLGSVCLGAGSIAYRYGPPGRPEIDIANAPDWSNVHLGDLQGGGLIQQHIRFTRGDHHYIVHFGEAGRYSDFPGRKLSGIAVVRGEGAEEIAALECRGGAGGDYEAFSRIPDQAPASVRDALREDEEGPFGGYY